MTRFLTPPEPLTKRQWTLVAIVALVCAATRFLAQARTLWEWDEALFTMAMRDYDVALHHPHPPGFPVYIAMARMARLFVEDDFRALQSVNLLAAMLVFPAVFFFARELRTAFRTAVIAGALFAFLPNVWFFGGSAFSDVPSVALVLVSVTFLLRGVRSRRSYWIGTFLLALAIGIRPQNLLVGLAPGLLSSWKRRWWEVLAALLIGIVVVGVAFAAAVYATGSLAEYERLVREHGDYIQRIDSFQSGARPPLWRVSDRFFVKQYQSPVLSILATLLVLVSLTGAIRERSGAMFWNAMTFGPFAIFAWLMLDRYSISRFSIGYQPMFAVFVADGIRRTAAWVSRRLETKGESDRASSVERGMATALIAAFFFYTLPALRPVRNEISPTILAARAAAERLDGHRDQLFAGFSMPVFLDLLAPEVPYVTVIDDRSLPLGAGERAWLLAEITSTASEGLVFERERGRLWQIARRRYFWIKLAPLHRRAQFLSGWHEPEVAGTSQWRWMAGRSTTLLPPVSEEALLQLHFGIPPELIPQRPTITVKVNGRVIDAIPVTRDSIEYEARVAPAPEGRPNRLELSIDRTLPAQKDGRQAAMRLRNLSWGARVLRVPEKGQ